MENRFGMQLNSSLAIWLAIVVMPGLSFAVTKENVDESRVPQYVLPDPLVAADGAPIHTADEWTSKRRPEILRLFETEVYGRAPEQKPELRFHVDEEDASALDGKAVRKQVTIHVSTPRGKVALQLLLYIPKVNYAAPVFLGLNFLGNQSVHTDPGIALSHAWILGKPGAGIVDHKATEASRGGEASRWQVGQVVGRGYAVATMCCGDIDPDFDDGFQNGVHPLFYRSAQTAPEGDEWGTIGAWSWGLSRALDYLETDHAVDAKHVAVLGHSNESGCGGAALSKRVFGETVGLINAHFPHWFCRNFRKYNDREELLPVDQHMLIALIAPRPVYVASAQEDRHADPRGEFLAARHADPVYQLFKLAGVGTDEMPPVSQPVGDMIRYHIRPGKHDITAYDWQQYLDFADTKLRPKTGAAPSKSN
jgi:(4-O-methyl)-D-glucuronate---lignin esterase